MIQKKVRQIKKTFGGAILGFLFLVGILLVSSPVYAMKADWTDPDYIKIMNRKEEEAETEDTNDLPGNQAADANPYTGKVYNHGTKLAHASLRYGIDVSKWQETISWSNVKNDGISFAFLRIGYTTTCADFSMHSDPYYAANYKGAKAQGIKLGVYYFSQAKTVEEAKQEAAYTLKLLNGAPLDLPIVFDYESIAKYRNYGLSITQGTAIAKAYCDIIRAAGYKTMVYANLNYVQTKLNMSALISNNYLWLARYNTETQYTGSYTFWQYTESGSVSGIGGDVDCDFWYYNSSDSTSGLGLPSASADFTVTTPTNVSAQAQSGSIALTWTGSSDAGGYEVLRSESYSGDYQRVASVTTTSYTDSSVTAGKEYYYQVVAYADVEGVTGYSSDSAVAYASVALSENYKVAVTSGTNIRQMADGSAKNLGSIASGQNMTFIAQAKGSDGILWYHVKYTSGGKTIEGYISGQYSQIKVGQVTGLKGKALTARSLNLSWQGQTDITGYEIYRSSAYYGKYTKVSSVTADKTSFKNTKLLKYAQYYYRVRAYITINGSTSYGSFSPAALLGGKSTSISMVVKAKKTKMNSFTGSGFSKLCVLYRGQTVKAINRTLDSKGNWWYLCKTKMNGKTICGYIQLSALKKKK